MNLVIITDNISPVNLMKPPYRICIYGLFYILQYFADYFLMWKLFKKAFRNLKEVIFLKLAWLGIEIPTDGFFRILKSIFRLCSFISDEKCISSVIHEIVRGMELPSINAINTFAFKGFSKEQTLRKKILIFLQLEGALTHSMRLLKTINSSI